jgi:hypothetical protein
MNRISISVNRNTVALLAFCAAGFIHAPAACAVQAGADDATRERAVEKRDPFWPIGFKPKYAIRSVSQGSPKAIPSNSWNEAMKKVVINGVSSRKNNEFIAVINGEVKQVGDTVSVSIGTSVYTWAVDAIESPGSVKLRRLSVRQG